MTAERKAYDKAYYAANKEKWVRDESARARRNTMRRKKYAEDAEYRAKMLARTYAYKKARPLRQTATMYGMEEDDLERLLDQGCQICHATKEANVGLTLCVDHKHSTGMVRGVLCQPSNQALGYLQDDPIRIMAMFDYLMRAETNGLYGAA